jgi:hypothetical protein
MGKPDLLSSRTWQQDAGGGLMDELNRVQLAGKAARINLSTAFFGRAAIRW